MPHRLTAWDAARRLATRELSAEALVASCLDRIAEREPEVHAFVQLDPASLLAQARWLDVSAWQGPLHGLPIGVKDIFDTVELPTGYGTPLLAGHRPAADAASVALCRAAGAIVAGKTATTELANMTPGPTRNPHDPAHTPGGSSSGSAAAVADLMLPLALGTQTAGSIIRPAAYCGVVGYKPSLGLMPRAGVKSIAESLDVVGGFGRSVRCVAMMASVLAGDDRLRAWADDDASPVPPPHIGFAQTDDWPLVDAELKALWSQVEQTLGPLTKCADAALPARFASLISAQKVVMAYEAARSLAHEHLRHRDALSPALREFLDEGRALDPTEHDAGRATARLLGAEVDALFDSHDVLITPGTHGEAPPGLSKTGDPLFCRAWSLLGLPCIHLPLGRGRHGMPIGLQLVGRKGEDAKLLAGAHWVHERLGG